jgi:hypothetical protein
VSDVERRGHDPLLVPWDQVDLGSNILDDALIRHVAFENSDRPDV